MKKLKGFPALILLGLLLISNTGCFAVIVGAAAGAGSYAWVRGVLMKEFEVPAEKLTSASISGLKKLELPLLDQASDRLSAKFRSKFADGESININVKALTERTSQIKIRVGVFGDQSRSEMILNSIQKSL